MKIKTNNNPQNIGTNLHIKINCNQKNRALPTNPIEVNKYIKSIINSHRNKIKIKTNNKPNEQHISKNFHLHPTQ